MDAKAKRRQATETVSAYHERCLVELTARVAASLDAYRAGELDIFAVDATIHQYHQAARKLWSFCWAGGSGSQIEFVAHLINEADADGIPADWWERAQPRSRR